MDSAGFHKREGKYVYNGSDHSGWKNNNFYLVIFSVGF